MSQSDINVPNVPISTSGDVDLDRYSRQIGTYGLEATASLGKLRVLVMGLNGTGLEIAKNLILTGPKSVHLFDIGAVSGSDLGANWALLTSDTPNGTKAEGCVGPLSELNDYVDVQVIPSLSSVEELSSYDVVVSVNLKIKYATQIDDFCRSNSIVYLSVWSFGPVGVVFDDFGTNHIIKDIDGEEAKNFVVESIFLESTETKVKGREGVYEHQFTLNFADDHIVSFGEGAVIDVSQLETSEGIRFSDEMGWDETVHLVVANVVNKYRLQCVAVNVAAGAITGDVTVGVSDKHSTPMSTAGRVSEVKLREQVHHRSLEEVWSSPAYEVVPTIDFGRFGLSETVFKTVRVLLEYSETVGHFPDVHDISAVRGVKSLLETKSIHGEVPEWGPEDTEGQYTDVPEVITRLAGCQYVPMCAALGGIVAQEVIKKTGKYTPLNQILVIDMLECVMGNVPMYREDPAEFTVGEPKDERYYDFIAMFGRKALSTITSSKLFVVGAGAIGCEYIKNLALLGCCSREGGLLTVTDMDSIEISNLSRQFLFRKHHVKQHKSIVAGEAAIKINAELKVNALQTRVEVASEVTDFSDKWFSEQNCILNALDNVPSRLYIDQRCANLGVPLVESGTLGCKGSVQPIVPGLTESYGDQRDPADTSIPMCTLRHFPNAIEHCMEWARDQFQHRFVGVISDTNEFLTSTHTPNKLESYFDRMRDGVSDSMFEEKMAEVCSLVKLIKDTMESGSGNAKQVMEKIIKYVYEIAVRQFDYDIRQLLFNFPPNHKTDSGAPFWSGAKRCPGPLPLSDAHWIQSNSANDDTMKIFLSFIRSGLHIMSTDVLADVLSNYNIDVVSAAGTLSDETLATMIASMSQNLDPFVPEEGMKIEEDNTNSDPAEANQSAVTLTARSDALRNLHSFAVGLTPPPRLRNVDFEKDEDANGHIEFIGAMGNMRARNYRITTIEPYQVKIMAGKIIPAVSTTTSLVTGLATHEMVKILLRDMSSKSELTGASPHEGKDIWISNFIPSGPSSSVVDSDNGIEMYKSAFINMAISHFVFTEPGAAKKISSVEYDPVSMGPVIARPEGFTNWASITVNGKGKTLQQILDIISSYDVLTNGEGNLTASIVSFGRLCVYMSYDPSHAARLALTIPQLIEEMSSKWTGDEKDLTDVAVAVEKGYINLEVSLETEEMDDVRTPNIKVIL